MPNSIDMTDGTFGRWTVIERNGVDSVGAAMWLCRCECGTISTISGKSMRSGKSKSCGCLLSEKTTERNLSLPDSHGRWGTLEYKSWQKMKERCYKTYDKRYKDYGGRGIIVCDRWLHSFSNFYADMGERPSKDHSLDRKDVNKNYEPSNCKWSTRIEQRNNRRDSVNR